MWFQINKQILQILNFQIMPIKSYIEGGVHLSLSLSYPELRRIGYDWLSSVRDMRE